MILHDGDDDGLVRRAIWAGRHENEYWNPATQVSLALGAATMSAIVPFALPGRMPALIGALTLTAAFSPLLPLRITSYNVCYTKLLRPQDEFRRMLAAGAALLPSGA